MSLSRRTHAVVANPADSQLEQILQSITQSHTLCLYWPGPEGLQLEIGGRDYWVPPDRGGAMMEHAYANEADGITPRMVKADGTLNVSAQVGRFGVGVRHHMDVIPFPLNGSAQGQGAGTSKPVPGGDAAFVVSVALRGYGEDGLIFLDAREPEKHEELKAHAKKVYREKRKMRVKSAIADYHRDLAEWQKLPANKGRTPPPPPDIILKHQEELDSFAVEDAQGALYVCQHCNYRSSEADKYIRHMSVAHNEEFEDDPNAIQEPKKHRGRKPGSKNRPKEASVA